MCLIQVPNIFVWSQLVGFIQLILDSSNGCVKPKTATSKTLTKHEKEQSWSFCQKLKCFIQYRNSIKKKMISVSAFQSCF